MTNETMERMKQLIEEKKRTSAKQGYAKNMKERQTGFSQKAFKAKKTGGAFDK